MRKIIAALHVSLDGFIEGASGETDWVGAWEDVFDLLPRIDTCVLGRGMYGDYERYWRAVLANPDGVLPITGRVATRGEIEYARFADRTPHLLLSHVLDDVGWANTRIVRNLGEIRELKRQAGKDMYAVGGATLVSSLLNAGLIDEVQLAVQPVVLGSGKGLFKDVRERHALRLLGAQPFESGMVRLTYAT